jgi:hypothetical protein
MPAYTFKGTRDGARWGHLSQETLKQGIPGPRQVISKLRAGRAQLLTQSGQYQQWLLPDGRPFTLNTSKRWRREENIPHLRARWSWLCRALDECRRAGLNKKEVVSKRDPNVFPRGTPDPDEPRYKQKGWVLGSSWRRTGRNSRPKPPR